MATRQAFHVFAAAADAAIPQGGVTGSDWADTHRVLSPEASAEPGRWRTSRVPFARRWMDLCSDPTVQEAYLMTSSQVSKSETLNNAVGYFIHHDPCPILFIQPTVDRMKDYSKKRIAPMLRDTPVLSAVVADESSRDSDNTVLSKSFTGGHLLMTGANAASALASNPIRVVLADEIDRYPRDVDNEGDPLTLAKVRTTTFSNRKIIGTSTPTIKGQSRIEEEFLKGTMERYHVPCPHCSTMQVLLFKDEENYRLVWEQDAEGDVTRCVYVCVHGCEIEEHHKLEMLAQGEWVAEHLDRKIVSCHINALYSPWFRWYEIAARFIEANKAVKEGKPELLKTFVNTILGETWDINQEGADIQGLENRVEIYNAEVPVGVLAVTAGVDVQPDRLECEVVGWGLDEESWSINYFILWGNPDQQQVWADLLEVLTRNYECEREDATGTRLTRTIDAACIDSGGHNTQAVYDFTKANRQRSFLAIKGSSSGAKEIIVKRPSKLKGGTLLYTVGTSLTKDKLFGQLKVEETGPGYCHFPAAYNSLDQIVPAYGDEYFKQLAGSEKRVKKLKKFDKNDPHGFSQYSYKKIRSRNEALDCRVYSVAALKHLNPNFPALLTQENLRCGKKIDTMYHDGNFVAENNSRFPRKFGNKQGFVTAYKRRS